MRLKDKVAIVTGGGSGFGEGISKRFAQEGAKVIVNDLRAEGGERVANEIARAGGQAKFVKGDVSKDADWAVLVKATLDAHGKLDIVVNNAGTTHRNQPILNVTEEQFDRVYAVNVKSLFWSVRNCVPVFRKQGGGVFITIASTAGVRPRPGLTWYIGTIPLGRMSRPADIANACLYLASDEAEFITGACIEVDGGRCV
jgi:3-oxoacyl-[acyl-carrier protein] reductase